ncbi:MAG: transposase [Myxococcales bacterium]|nr:transposase [Myxococcales bacterium]
MAAINLEDFVEETCFEDSLNDAYFSEWVRHHLVPHLRPKDIVVQDNVISHHREDALEAIEQAGAFVFFLPPHSPDAAERTWVEPKFLLLRSADSR